MLGLAREKLTRGRSPSRQPVIRAHPVPARCNVRVFRGVGRPARQNSVGHEKSFQVAPTKDVDTVVGVAVSCENVEAVPCAYVSGPFVNTDPALLPFTWAISCRGVPVSTAIHIPAVNAVPIAVVSVVPPSAVVAVITVPAGKPPETQKSPRSSRPAQHSAGGSCRSPAPRSARHPRRRHRRPAQPYRRRPVVISDSVRRPGRARGENDRGNRRADRRNHRSPAFTRIMRHSSGVNGSWWRPGPGPGMIAPGGSFMAWSTRFV